MASQEELRILTPIGMLGYGYDASLFWTAVETGVDAIICDSGSTDSGPGKLAKGTTTVPKEAYRRDLEHMVKAVHSHKMPVLIGSAGGSGTNKQVDMLAAIIENLIHEHKLRTMKVVKIYSEVDKEHVRKEMQANRIRPCGEAVPALEARDIDDASCIVAQMGLEPYFQAMTDVPDFDIIIGGRSYDPAPYAAFCVYKGFNNLGIDYHMGKVLECGAVCAQPKSREILAVVRHDSFDVVPLEPSARCTSVSVAAHSLYEKTRPDLLAGPGGILNLTDTTYEQLADGRTVRCRGATFNALSPGEYTVKLEAARLAGYHSMFFGGFSDPILIAQKDYLFGRVKDYVAERCHFPHELKLTTYGGKDDISMFKAQNVEKTAMTTLGVCGESKADTQEQANAIVNAARIACIHGAYPGQRATAGNFAMPIGPLDIPLGRLCEFCIYHLMTVTDPVTMFPTSVEEMQGSEDSLVKVGTSEKELLTTRKFPPQVNARSESLQLLSPPLPTSLCYVGEFASVVRSKNSGPYEVTFDIMVDTQAQYNHIKSSGVLTQTTIAELYNVDAGDVVAAVWWPQALAFKATLKRPIVSGGFGETDTHGSCQHVRLMYLQMPALV